MLTVVSLCDYSSVQSDSGARAWHSTWRGLASWPWPWVLDSVTPQWRWRSWRRFSWWVGDSFTLTFLYTDSNIL